MFTHQAMICGVQIVEEQMRTTIRAALVVVGLSFLGMPAVMAGPAGPTVGEAGILGNLVEPVQFWGWGRCERLRRACVQKDERGETGEGNCRRYREECQRGGYCERLRRACIDKDERGETGEGNCRRYRRECRDR